MVYCGLPFKFSIFEMTLGKSGMIIVLYMLSA